MSKYEPRYEHDYYKIDLAPFYKKKKMTEEKKIYSDSVKEYNKYYEKLLSGDRSSEVFRKLDNLQDTINGDQT